MIQTTSSFTGAISTCSATTWLIGKITAYEISALLNVDIRTLALKDDPIGKIQSAPEGSLVTIDYKFPKPGTTQPVPKQRGNRAGEIAIIFDDHTQPWWPNHTPRSACERKL
jgi:hypothetical protein